MAINITRICDDLQTLGNIGFVQGQGTNRVAYSDDFIKGRNFVKKLMEDAGLKTSVDSVGNLSGIISGKNPYAPRVLVGSHIDSVPNGGIYDGCLGVLSAIECIREMKCSGFEPTHSIEIVAFIEEEGNAVGGTFGSKCFTGKKISNGEIQKASAFKISEADILHAKHDNHEYLSYLELHIEQGGVLENDGLDIGIVEGIVGITRWKLEMLGTANHAGTTPMRLRNDAMWNSVIALNDLYQRVISADDNMVCTVGIYDIENPAINVIPAQTSFYIETRHSKPSSMHGLVNSWLRQYEPVGLNHSLISDQKETLMDTSILNLIEDSCKDFGYTYKRMFSGAGHDAMNLASFVPSAMIFIPSVGGISHSIREFSTPHAIQKGTQILYDVLCKLSSENA